MAHIPGNRQNAYPPCMDYIVYSSAAHQYMPSIAIYIYLFIYVCTCTYVYNIAIFIQYDNCTTIETYRKYCKVVLYRQQRLLGQKWCRFGKHFQAKASLLCTHRAIVHIICRLVYSLYIHLDSIFTSGRIHQLQTKLYVLHIIYSLEGRLIDMLHINCPSMLYIIYQVL